MVDKEKRMILENGKGYFLADEFVKQVDMLVKLVANAEILSVIAIVLAVAAIILAILL